MAKYALEKLKEIGKGYLRICRRGKSSAIRTNYGHQVVEDDVNHIVPLHHAVHA